MLSEILASLGLGLLIYRLWPRTQRREFRVKDWPFVSIIVPARNEAANLKVLIPSLKQLDYPNYEIIVVDDMSTDGTGDLAESMGVKVLRNEQKPDGWFGKPWACHQGSLIAKGEYYLFTDADTMHRPESLKIAVEELISKSASGLSALPFHQSPSIWERLLGPFQVLLMALTNPYGSPAPGRVFAIGQYLLFPKVYYDKIFGHEGIKDEAIDDLALANRVLQSGGHWQVHTAENLYEVKMYESFSDFVKGWRRNFRGGLKHNSSLSSVEVFLIFMAITIGFNGQTWPMVVTVVSLILFAIAQRKLGAFSIWGVLLFPFSILVFTWVTLLAVYDLAMSKPLLWKGRSY